MTRPVFYVDPGDLEGRALGDSMWLGGSEGHHAKNVKRITTNESIDLVDGRGHRAVCTVTSVESDGLRLTLASEVNSDPASGIVLVQALAKGDRDLMAVEMATELGASAIVPWQAERSIVRWKGDRAAKAHAKWVKTVEAAAKQARRSLVPRVEPLHSTRQLTNILGSGDSMFILHEEAQVALTTVAARENDESSGTVFLVVGPEGGIGADEASMLEAAGGQCVRLGWEILRSSTAGAAAMSVLHAIRGSWD